MDLYETIENRRREIAAGGVMICGEGDTNFLALFYSDHPVVGHPGRLGPWTRYAVATRYKDRPDKIKSEEWLLVMKDHKRQECEQEVIGPLLFQRIDEASEFIKEKVKNPYVEAIPVTVKIEPTHSDHLVGWLSYLFVSREQFERLATDYEDAHRSKWVRRTRLGPMTVVGRDETHYVVELDARGRK